MNIIQKILNAPKKFGHKFRPDGLFLFNGIFFLLAAIYYLISEGPGASKKWETVAALAGTSFLLAMIFLFSAIIYYPARIFFKRKQWRKLIG